MDPTTGPRTTVADAPRTARVPEPRRRETPAETATYDALSALFAALTGGEHVRAMWAVR